MHYDPQHVIFGSWLPGPDFELACALLHKHLKTGDDRDILLASHTHEWCIDRVIDEVEDKSGSKVIGVEKWRSFEAFHSYGRGIDDDIELGFRESLLLDDLRMRLPGQLLRSLHGAVQNGDIRALITKPKDCRAGRSTSTKDKDL